MSKPKEKPPEEIVSGDEALERMKALTKRILQVPKKGPNQLRSPKPKPA